MIGNYRSAAVAVGLTCLTWGVSAQEPRRPAVDLQKLQREQTGASNSDEGAKPQQSEDYNLLPALVRIEAAIRSLKAEVNQTESEQKDQREKADLVAQQEMSRWAWWMMIPTWITTALTFAALLAILRTLHHTRRAADYSRDMVKEGSKSNTAAFRAASAAEEGVQAARDSVSLASETAQRQLRAYLLHKEPNQTWNFENKNEPPTSVEFGIRFVNTGQTPAMRVKIFSDVRKIAISEIGSRIAFGKIAQDSPTGDVGQQLEVSSMPFSIKIPDIIDAFKRDLRYIIYARSTYVDVFKVDRFSECCFIIDAIDIPPNLTDIQRHGGASFRPTLRAYPHHNNCD